MREMKFSPEDVASVPHRAESESIVTTLEQLSAHLGRHEERLSSLALQPPDDGTDQVYVFHYWMLKRSKELAEEVTKAIKKLEESWERHVAQALEARGADGTVALGRKLMVAPDFDPGVPGEK